MMHKPGRPARQQQARERQQPARRGEASEHGHTGEGSASVLAHMLSEAERQRRQNGEPVDIPDREHP